MSIVQQESTPDLIKRLIHCLQGQDEINQRRRRCKDTRNTNRRLRRMAFEVLLFGSRGKCDYEGLSPIDRMYAVIFNLRCDEKYNEANQLEACVFKLKNDNLVDNDTTKNIFSFLLSLRNEGEECEDCLGSYPQWQKPFPPLFKPTTPDGPLAYPSIGSVENTFYYTSFPAELFEKPAPELRSPTSHSWNLDPKMFELPPGANQFVTFPSMSKTSDYLRQLSQTLFGALSHPIVDPTNMDFRLEIPELGDMSPSTSLSSYICGRGSAKSQISEDEGFTEPETPMTDVPGKSTSIWETVLDMDPRTYYTWEDLGSHVIHREKPYLTESGLQAINEIENLWERELHLLHPELNFPSWITKNPDELLRDMSYVLLGISSQCFWFSDKENKFVPSDNILVVGWSHQGLIKLLSEFAKSGTYYYRLRSFCEEKLPLSASSGGLIFRAFTRGVRRGLNYYNALVLTVKPRDTVLGFVVATVKIREHIQNLASLCNLDEFNSQSFVAKFPTGMNLLSYLYSTAMAVVGSDFYIVVLSLLSTSSAPYLKFLHNWVYNGLCEDPYDEFPIKPNENYILCRDHRYWSKAFVLSINENCPLIPQDLMSRIHVCGKGVNLLKLCSPQHHLCNTHEFDAPQLKLTCSKSELDTFHWKSAQYTSSMESLRKEKCLSWGEVEEQRQLEKKNLQRDAAREASLTMERVEKRIAEQREAKAREKRRQMTELQVQIKEVQLRKKREKDEIKKQDEEIQRDIDHYHSLNAKAELKARKNDWRSRRMRLNSARVEFLEQDRRLNTLNLAAMHTVKDFNNLLHVQEQPMQISPDQICSSEICTSESFDSFDTNVSLDSVTLSNIKEMESRLIMNNDICGNNDTLTQPDANQNAEAAKIADANENLTTANIEKSNKLAQRPHLLPLDTQTNVKKNMVPHKPIRGRPRLSTGSDTSVVGDVTDWPNDDIIASKTREGEEDKKNGKELILRLISEDSSGRDSGMSLQTPASDELGDEKLDTPMSTLSNTQSSDSVISSFISIEDDYICPGLALLNAGVMMKSRGRSDHGHASESTLQALMYPEKLKQQQQQQQSLLLKTSVTRDQLFDVKNLNTVRLRRKNIYGHSSDSTIQTVMYGEKCVSAPETPIEEPKEAQKQVVLRRSKSVVTPYSESFNFQGKYPLADMMSPVHVPGYNNDDEDTIQEHLPLPVFVQQSLVEPLMSQISLVNKAIHDFYLVDLKIVEHLEVLRSFYLLHDGEFAQLLTDQLFDKMTSGTCPAELLNPVTLNSILKKSMNASLQREHPLVKNFSFGLNSIPQVFPLHVAAPFEGLELHYKVSWPLNVIITDSCLSKYNKLFRFLMQIRHALWALTDVFYHLKRHVRYQAMSPQFTQLQLFRHELHHFARVLQAYISNQVLQVSWAELRRDLSADSQVLDHLHNVHVLYLNRAIYRCLLHKKAAPVMKVIQTILSIILKFHAQMTSVPWKKISETGVLVHPSYAKLVASYRVYQQYSGFLYKVMTKLVMRGYQQHLNEFLLKFNFNSSETHFIERSSSKGNLLLKENNFNVL